MIIIIASPLEYKPVLYDLKILYTVNIKYFKLPYMIQYVVTVLCETKLIFNTTVIQYILYVYMYIQYSI